MKLVFKTIVSLVALILFLSIISLVGVKIYDKPSSSSVYNADYNGFSDIYEMLRREGYNMKIEASDSGNVSYLGTGTLWVIFSPTNKYTEKEKEKLKDFVSRGGYLLVADRFDGGRELAGVFDITLFGHALVDYSSYVKRQDLPVLPAALDSQTTYALVYKFPAAIDNYPENTRIISKSSRISFIDTDDNGKITSKDYGGSFPVAVETKYEKGTIVFFSDPNVFSNDLIGRKDNLKFARDLVFSLNPQLIVFDESHGQGAELTQNTKLLVLVGDMLKNYKMILAITLIVAVLFLLWKILILPRRNKEEHVASYRPTEYSQVVQRILANSGNNVYIRRWIILTAYNKLKKNILAKTRTGSGKDVTKEELVINSGLNGREKDNLASTIELGMSLERGGKASISSEYMKEAIAEMERLNNLI